MSLGIYDRLWELLEKACTELDLLLAEHTSVGGDGNTYFRYVEALRKKEKLTSTLTTAEQCATLLDQLVSLFSLHVPNAAHQQQLIILRQEASNARLGVNALVQQ